MYMLPLFICQYNAHLHLHKLYSYSAVGFDSVNAPSKFDRNCEVCDKSIIILMYINSKFSVEHKSL